MNHLQIGNEAFSEIDPTLKTMENAQNLEVSNSNLLDDGKEQDDNVKSNLEEMLLESGVDVVVGSKIVDVIGNNKLNIFEIEQKIDHKYFDNKVEQSIKERIKHQLHKLVEVNLIKEKFTNGAEFYLSEKLKELLNNKK